MKKLLVAVTFQPTCPAPTACGGDVVGSWEYTSGCVSTDQLFPTLRQSCTGLTLTNMSGDSRGSVIFTAATVTRAIATKLAGTASVPGTCNPLNDCGTVQTALAAGAKTVTCSAGAANACTCVFTVEASTIGAVAYTKGTNQLTTEPGTADATTYDYCIAGAVFTYSELGSPQRDPGVFVMGKK